MPAPKASSGANSVADSATLPLTLPASIAAGDLILVRWSTNTGSPTTITINGSGYTVGEDNTASGAVASKLWWKVATAGDAGSTVTATYAASSRLSAACVVMAAGDFDPAAPLNAVTSLFSQAGPTITQPAVTTTADGCTILAWDVQQSAGAPSFTPPPGFTNVILSTTDKPSGKNNSEAVAWAPSGTKGTYGPWTATYNNGGGDGNTHTIAIAPKPSAGGTTYQATATSAATSSATVTATAVLLAAATIAGVSTVTANATRVPQVQQATVTIPATTGFTVDATRLPRTFPATATIAATSSAAFSPSLLNGPATLPATITVPAASTTSIDVTALLAATVTTDATSSTSADATVVAAPVAYPATVTFDAISTVAADATVRSGAGSRDLKILSTSVPTTGWDANGPVTAWTTETPATTDWPTTSPAAAWATSTPEH